MVNINIDFSQTTGKIKAMHAVGQPPFTGTDFSYLHYLDEANIPFSRLHDVGGRYGANCFVDIPNIFRNFDADENNPESYDFAFTDLLIKALKEHNCNPIFRLGVTIENFHQIKAYRIFPPKDFAKWARICEKIVRHYNEGWANGYHYGIVYWEIWNEPENDVQPYNQMWKGTDEEYFELYDITSKHLKNCFGDSIKIGGYSSCGFYGELPKGEFDIPPARAEYLTAFFLDFMKYIKEHNSPLDFFSWHSYGSVEQTEIMDEFVDKTLNEYGYSHVEPQINEWNNAFSKETRGTSQASAKAAAMMCSMQNRRPDILCYYDARIGISGYGGLFNPLTFEPFCTYYSFKAFGELYKRGNQVKCESDKKGVYAVAATDGNEKAILISNISGEDANIITNCENMTVYIIDEENFFTETKLNSKQFTIKQNQVVFLKK